MVKIEDFLKQKCVLDVKIEGFKIGFRKNVLKFNQEQEIIENLSNEDIKNYEQELQNFIKNINDFDIKDKNILLGMSNCFGGIKYYNEKIKNMFYFFKFISEFGIINNGKTNDKENFNEIDISIYINDNKEFIVRCGQDGSFILITNKKYDANELNISKEKLDIVATGRIYPKYKKLIDKHNINVGQLIMEAIDNMGLK